MGTSVNDPGEYFGSIRYRLEFTGNGVTFDSVQDLMDTLLSPTSVVELYQKPNTPDADAAVQYVYDNPPTWSFANGLLTVEVKSPPPAGVDADRFGLDDYLTRADNTNVIGLETLPIELDLSTDEFAVVVSDDSTVNTVGLSNSAKVADLLNSLFDFDAVIGGTTDNGEINTTIFAVTAEDDKNVTAIWAHTQSSFDDHTVDAHELSLLATVNTLGDEFWLQNFAQNVMPG